MALGREYTHLFTFSIAPQHFGDCRNTSPNNNASAESCREVLPYLRTSPLLTIPPSAMYIHHYALAPVPYSLETSVVLQDGHDISSRASDRRLVSTTTSTLKPNTSGVLF